MIRHDPLRAAADRLRIVAARPVHECKHPLDALRFDGEWPDPEGSAVYALMTCLPERGGCGTSRCIPVREDVREKALRNGADAFHGPKVAPIATQNHAEAAPGSAPFGALSG